MIPAWLTGAAIKAVIGSALAALWGPIKEWWAIRKIRNQARQDERLRQMRRDRDAVEQARKIDAQVDRLGDNAVAGELRDRWTRKQ